MTEKDATGLHCAAATGDRCGEGAVWHAADAALYWADINRFLIHRLETKDGSVRTWFFDEPVTALALTEREDTLLVVFGSRVCLWKPQTNAIVKEIFRLEGWPAVRFNDARVDVRGSLWAGTMFNNVAPDGSDREVTRWDGALYRIDPDGSSRILKKNIGIANTVVWSPDWATFYFADSLANTIFAYDYDATTGEIAGERLFLHGFERGVPDGSSVDAEGYIWNCRPHSGCLIRIAPDGKVVKVYEMPVHNPTTCVFGGPDLSTLYITSLKSDERLAGCLFAMRSGTRGLPENRFGVASGG